MLDYQGNPTEESFKVSETLPNVGVKYDKGKVQWHYLAGVVEPMNEVMKVLAYGDNKYPAADGCNWRRVDDSKRRYSSALLRHITAWMNSEQNDQESNLHHLAHAVTNCLFLMHKDMQESINQKESN